MHLRTTCAGTGDHAPARASSRWARCATGRSTNSPSGSRSAAPPAASKASTTSPRPGQLPLGRREHLVQDRQLPRVDGRLAEEPQRPRELGLRPQLVVVVEVREDAVDRRLDPGRPRADDEVAAHVERVAGCRRRCSGRAAGRRRPWPGGAPPARRRSRRRPARPRARLDRADDRHARGPGGDPRDVVGRFDLGDADAVRRARRTASRSAAHRSVRAALTRTQARAGAGGSASAPRPSGAPRPLRRAAPRPPGRASRASAPAVNTRSSSFGVVARGEEVAAVHQTTPFSCSSASCSGVDARAVA